MGSLGFQKIYCQKYINAMDRATVMRIQNFCLGFDLPVMQIR